MYYYSRQCLDVPEDKIKEFLIDWIQQGYVPERLLRVSDEQTRETHSEMG
jgi:hypothetical protein